jgi:hypothetical protein
MTEAQMRDALYMVEQRRKLQRTAARLRYWLDDESISPARDTHISYDGVDGLNVNLKGLLALIEAAVVQCNQWFVDRGVVIDK